MPPILALLGCTVFVVFLLRLERKQSAGVTGALWIPTISLLLAGGKPLSVYLGLTRGNPEVRHPLDVVVLVVLYLTALWTLARRHFDWAAAARRNSWLVVLVAYMLVSVAWSHVLLGSLKAWAQEAGSAVVAFVILTESSPRLALESVFRRVMYILIPYSMLLVKYYPHLGVEYGRWSGVQMWIGVTLQKNGLGRLCLLAVFFQIWSLVRRRRGELPSVGKFCVPADLLVLFIALWLLKGPGMHAYSATALFSLAAGLLVFAAFLFANKRGLTVKSGLLQAAIAGIIVFGVVALFTSGSSLGFLATSANRDATLTGRTEVWRSLLPVAMSRPVQGSGVGGFWNPASRKLFNISEGHSGYLDIMLSLGFAGLLLMSLFLLSSCRKAHRCLSRDFTWGVLWFCCLLMTVIHNITETSLDSLTNQLTWVIVFLSITPLSGAEPDSASPAEPPALD